MEYQVRTPTAAELEAYVRQMSLGFHFDPGDDPARIEGRRPLYDYENNVVAVDGDAIVGTAGNFKQVMRVPGGDVGCAGLTQVTVRASHRRKGVLTSMMRKHLGMAHERGDELAALWASESIIYGRFGYGLAADGVDLSISTRHVALKDGTIRATCRYVDKADVLAAWPAIWDAVRTDTAGMPSRSALWWEEMIAKDPDWRR
ncbi:MAG: GNAT family N-acetyltransferase, partial [Dehalococcoidia bacterium]